MWAGWLCSRTSAGETPKAREDIPSGQRAWHSQEARDFWLGVRECSLGLSGLWAPPQCLGSWRKGFPEALSAQIQEKLRCPQVLSQCLPIITTDCPPECPQTRLHLPDPPNPVRLVPLTKEETEALGSAFTVSGSQSAAELGLSGCGPPPSAGGPQLLGPFRGCSSTWGPGARPPRKAPPTPDLTQPYRKGSPGAGPAACCRPGVTR